ncbi:MAG: hypothetical protein A3G87_09315 [Omnitrophica bacterium RIFCSPLOWO2_12_FULL_50_11]|nr:MAG: hypothetical protein A3G87_09315 [Omnitrophica bacterium RIFCSPLOWO2_12_FULL_50_11]
MDDRDKKICLREIEKDIAFFNKSYRRADHHVDIAGLDVKASVRKLKELLHEESMSHMRHAESEACLPLACPWESGLSQVTVTFSGDTHECARRNSDVPVRVPDRAPVPGVPVKNTGLWL